MNNPKDTAVMSPARELLNRKEAGSGLHPPRAMEHLALALLLAACGDMADSLAALSRLRRDFVDWNEVRVARVQEIVRSLGEMAGAEEAARRIKEEYNAFFEKKGALNFDFLAAGKPSETRRQLNQLLPRIGKGAAALLLYEFCPGASLPLSDEGLRQARKDGVVGKSADRNQVARALADGLEQGESAMLIQYWELEGSGSPYGESPPRKETAKAVKKEKKAPKKAKGKK